MRKIIIAVAAVAMLGLGGHAVADDEWVCNDDNLLCMNNSNPTISGGVCLVQVWLKSQPHPDVLYVDCNSKWLMVLPDSEVAQFQPDSVGARVCEFFYPEMEM